MRNDPPILLLAEDSETDTLLMKSACRKAGFTNPLQTVKDGVEAMNYLAGEAPYTDRYQFPLPTVLLLDLNMPRKNGFEVLAWVRQHPALKRLPIFVLSSSERVVDVEQAFNLGANAYLMKPGTLHELIDLAKCLGEWLAFNHFSPCPELAEPGSGVFAPETQKAA